MICKDCKFFRAIKNTDECGEGLCLLSPSAIPVKVDNECLFTPQPYKCVDCDNWENNEFLCATHTAEDSAYGEDGKLCPGFIDKYEIKVYEALYDWRMRGYDHMGKLQAIAEDFNQNAELPF